MTTRCSPRAGFTLLEVMLVILITSVLVTAVAAALNIYLRAVETGRAEVEQAQLARALLQRIGDDLRNSVPYARPQSSGGSGASSGGSSMGGGAAGGSGSTGGNGSESGSSATITNITGSTGVTDLSASGSSGSSGSNGGSSGGSGGSSMNSGSASQAANAAASALSGTDEESTPGVVAPSPGIIGTQYQLQVDVTRLPTVDQFGGVSSLAVPQGAAPIGLTSDLKTVTYYVAANYVASAVQTPPTETPTPSQGGLVIRQVDRAVNNYLTNYGGTTELGQYERILAPEATALEFRYFDGSEWVVEWDSEARQALPVAVEVLLTLRAPPAKATSFATSLVSSSDVPQDSTYRLLVQLPTAEPSTAADAALAESLEASSDTDSTP